MLEVFLATMAFGVASFSLLLVSLRAQSQLKMPLAILLSCLLLLSSCPLIFKLAPSLVQLFVSILPLLFYSLLPALWFYHEALTAKTFWRWRLGMWKHLSTLPFAFILGVALLMMPTSDFNIMFIAGQEQVAPQLAAISMAFLFAIIFWCLLSFIYIARLIKSTLVYRQRLKDVYANEEGRDLNWLVIVFMLVLVTWIYALIVLVVDNRLQSMGISENGVLFLLTVIVWLISVNGLRQRPGFDNSIVTDSVSLLKDEKKTYQRSAVTDEHLSRIVEKLSTAISQNKVHLNSELSLAKLAEVLREPPQYISQTLSQILCCTFYDFINKARIENAKKMLMESDYSVIEITLATGFNSRSSFYKAFKQFTGMTPSQFRKSKY